MSIIMDILIYCCNVVGVDLLFVIANIICGHLSSIVMLCLVSFLVLQS